MHVSLLPVIHNSVMMLEMLLLSIMASRIYSQPPGKSLERVNRDRVVVAVLEDSTLSIGIDVRNVREGIDNKSFNNNNNVVVDD